MDVYQASLMSDTKLATIDAVSMIQKKDTRKTPNDPKLSDSGPGARMGARRREAKARAVPGFMAGRTARD